jgi:glycosyltransferase involved in cell wall biosynthesis
MKVLFVIGATPPIQCGVGDQTYKLAKSLKENFGIEVVLYTYNRPKVNEKSKIFTYFFHDSKVKFYLKLIYILLKERPTVTQMSYPNRGFSFEYPYLMSFISRLFTKKVIITFHEVPGYVSKFNWFLLNRVPHKYILVRNQIAQYLNLKNYAVVTNFSNIPISDLSEKEGEELKNKIAKKKKLCTHFGFISHIRCVEQIFEVLDPEEYHFLLIGDLGNDEYSQMLRKKIESKEWKDSVTVTGYLSDKEVADHLFASDVVILPFKEGSHDANTSTKAATIQGTYLITTSKEKNGYDNTKNIFYTTPGKIDEIKNALNWNFIKFPKQFNSDDTIIEISKKYLNIFNNK